MGTVILLFCAMIFLNSQVVRDNDYLSLTQTKNLKGVFAIVVLIHHLSDYIKGEIPSIFQTVGYVAVGFFFFLSAYGSVLQVEKEKTDYLRTYARKKMINIIIPYLEVTVIYWLYLVIVEAKDLSLIRSIINAFTIHYIASNCWYIVALIYFYIAFGIGTLISIKTGKKLPIVLSTLLYLAAYYIYYNVYNQMNSPTVIGLHWVYSTLIIFAGVLWGMYRGRFEKKLPLLFGASIILLIAIYEYERITNHRWSIELHNLKALIYVVIILYASSWIKLDNCVLRFLGDISFEIYMIHGLVLRGALRWVGRDNELVLGLFVLVISIAVAWVLHNVFVWQKKILNNVSWKKHL